LVRNADLAAGPQHLAHVDRRGAAEDLQHGVRLKWKMCRATIFLAQALRCRAGRYRSFAATADVALPVADRAIDDREQRVRVGRGACARPAPRLGTAPAQLVE